MCHEGTIQTGNSDWSRREFSALTASAALAGMLASPANAAQVIESDVMVPTPDGEADCYFVRPSSGKHPGVLIWPDALGLRPAFQAMGKRLAESGYAVLVVNPYYRIEPAPQVVDGATIQDKEVLDKVMARMGTLTPEIAITDTKAFVAYLDAQSSVDKDRKIGTMGYCMGGSLTMRTAAAVPDRIGAGASFHGGRLVTDGDNSPHLLVPKMKASFLFAIAENDDENDPHEKTGLRKAYDAAGLSAEIEVYEGAMHGWCPPDMPMYNEAQAERAWSRLLVLFEEALG